MMRRLLPWISLLALTSACERKSPEPTDFGLDVYDLWMESEDRSELYSSTFEDTPVPVRIYHNGDYKPGSIFHTGNSTVLHPKRSYEVELKGSSKIEGHDRIRLSAQAFDASALRSLLAYKVFQSLGILTPGIKPIAVYLNGDYQGLYFQIEKITEDFLKAHGQTPASLYKARFGRLGFAGFEDHSYNDLEVGYKLGVGTKGFEDLKHLIALVQEPDSPENDRQLEAALDIESYLRYLAGAVIFLNHWDGFYNNYYIYRDKESQRFRFVAWDVDQIFKPDTMHFTEGETIFGRNALSRKLLRNPEHRRAYLGWMRELLTVTLPPPVLEAFIDEQKSLIRHAYEADPFVAEKDLDTEAAALQSLYQDWFSKILADIEASSD